MGCSINPFGKPTEHRPARLGESTTQLICHGKAMVGGGAGAHHRNSCAGIQMLEQRSIPLDIERGRRRVQAVQTVGPGRVTRQKRTGRNIKCGGNSLLTPVTIDSAQTVRRPAQSLAKAVQRPAPELIRPKGLIAAERTQIRHAGVPQARATDPAPPPPPHQTQASTCVLAQSQVGLGVNQGPCCTSRSITSCSSEGTRLSTRP